MNKTKVCTKCKKELNINLFHKDKTKPDGLYPSCCYCRSPKERKTKEIENLMAENGWRRCPICKDWLPLSEFYKRRSGKIICRCKKCFASDEMKERFRQSYLNHREHRLMVGRARSYSNLEKKRLYGRKTAQSYYRRFYAVCLDKNKTEISKYRRKDWQSRNREKLIAYSQNRRLLTKEKINASLLINLMSFYSPDGICPSCGNKAVLTIDHVIPLSKGGEHRLSNIQPLCLVCNCTKSNKVATDYRSDYGKFAALLEEVK